MSGTSNGPEFQAAPLITGAALVGAGTLIALVGLAIGGGHLVSATRRWVNELETPPSELAKIKWAQARAAYAAGASAWQNGSQPSVTSAS
jgi:membrane protein implicated in regulation of membrane protease activity